MRCCFEFDLACFMACCEVWFWLEFWRFGVRGFGFVFVCCGVRFYIRFWRVVRCVFGIGFDLLQVVVLA